MFMLMPDNAEELWLATIRNAGQKGGIEWEHWVTISSDWELADGYHLKSTTYVIKIQSWLLLWLLPRSTPIIICYKQNFESHWTADSGPTSSFLLTRELCHFSCMKFTNNASSIISCFLKVEGALRLLWSSKYIILLGFLEPSTSHLLYLSCPNLIQFHFLFKVTCLSKAIAFVFTEQFSFLTRGSTVYY